MNELQESGEHDLAGRPVVGHRCLQLAKGAAAVAGSKMSAGRRNLGAAEVPGC